MTNALSEMTPDDFRAWRTRLGLSLTEAGAALGISRSQVMRYQSGYTPTPETVAKLCDALERLKRPRHEKP